MRTKRFLISGRVQGVGFRYFTWRKMQDLPLKGFVRNLADGRVEIVVQGEEQALKALEKWLPYGVPTAKVQSIQQESLEGTEEFTQFSVRRK